MSKVILFYVAVFWFIIGYRLIIPKDSPFEEYYFYWEKSSALLWASCIFFRAKIDRIVMIPVLALMVLRLIFEIPQMANYYDINNASFLNGICFLLGICISISLLLCFRKKIVNEINSKKAEKQYYEAIAIEYREKTKQKSNSGEIIDDTKKYEF